MRQVLTAIALALWSGAAAWAACDGRDLIAAMAPADRAAFEARLAAVPHAEGLIWRATRGDAIIHMVGTYHFDDPRHDSLMVRVRPLLETADRLLLEAGPEEEAALLRALAERPGVLFVTDGPTLPERLPEAEWQALMAALRARGLPVVVAAKSRPWFVASQLSLPPCLTRDGGGGKRGLDHRILALAEARGIPVGSLESHDTLFRLFEALPEDGELGLIRAALLMEGEAEDMSATLTEAYFAERPWAIWEFTKDRAARTPGISPEAVAWQIALTEDVMMARRNRAWIPVLTAAARGGEVLAAFGALHLPGPEGVLALLEAEGFSVTRLR